MTKQGLTYCKNQPTNQPTNQPGDSLKQYTDKSAVKMSIVTIQLKFTLPSLVKLIHAFKTFSIFCTISAQTAYLQEPSKWVKIPCECFPTNYYLELFKSIVTKYFIGLLTFISLSIPSIFLASLCNHFFLIIYHMSSPHCNLLLSNG